MNIITQFTSNPNLSMLWDVLLGELNINTTNKQLITNIRVVFESNLQPFTTRININSRPKLMDLNKQFLQQVVLAVNKLFPKDKNIQRITITNEEVSEPYKIEDIHASRQSDFEKEVIRKQTDLENYMTVKKPQGLDFSDKMSDNKITEMGSLVAEKMAERNLEMELLQNTNYNTNGVDKDKWLSSVETSVKGEKVESPYNNGDISNNNRLKHINIDDSNNIILVKEKKVSWSNDEVVDNIFLKLKKRPEEPEQLNTHNLLVGKNYVEQHSVSLPEVRQEVVPTNNLTIPMGSNDPIIPKGELISQMNDMNAKIDNLYDMVTKLTKLLETHSSLFMTDIQETDIQETDIQETETLS